MILSDREIRTAIKQRHIVIDPQPVEEQYNTSALDLRLSDELIRPLAPLTASRDNFQRAQARHDLALEACQIIII
jgi:deoxycytidine triphosphate deaminase